MIVFPNCKINIGLRILRKRSDGFHDLETLFYPLGLQDALEILPSPSPENSARLTVSGLELDPTTEDNICIKAYRLLQKDFPRLPPVVMHLHKVIPAGAGLGGGSADGTFALALLNSMFNLGLEADGLFAYALALGSDCPFFIVNKPSLATGRGEKLHPVALDFSGFQILLVNPGISIPTAWAFSLVRPEMPKYSLAEAISRPIEEWKSAVINDFEGPVCQRHPEIGRIKNLLYEQGAVYASMSGSGSSVFGIFPRDVTPELDLPAHYFVKTL